MLIMYHKFATIWLRRELIDGEFVAMKIFISCQYWIGWTLQHVVVIMTCMPSN
jgi:hypothetical protein